MCMRSSPSCRQSLRSSSTATAAPLHYNNALPNIKQTKAFGGALLTSFVALYLGTSSCLPLVGDGFSQAWATALMTTFLVSVYTVAKVMELSRNYWDNMIHQVDDVMTKVGSSQTLTRIRSSATAVRLMELAHLNKTDKACEPRPNVIAAKDCFLPDELASTLSLSDLKDLLRYVVDLNRLDFNKQDFLSTMRPLANDVVQAIDRVLVKSRGSKVALSTPPPSRGSPGDETSETTQVGNVDALAFCAFVRIFAEWRAVRLVPEGHKRYAMGMGLAKRDLLQNVQKLETAAHNFISYHERLQSHSVGHANGRQLSSPTLKQLLIWERDQDFHSRLPRLADKSGASGLLWIYRQIQYQTSIFVNLTQVPALFPNAKMAVAAAYQTTYEDYHGFFVKQVFQGSFDAAPDAKVILYHMNQPGDASDGVTEATESVASTCPSEVVLPPENPIEQLGSHIANEWMKLERFFNQCKGLNKRHDSRNVLELLPEQSQRSVKDFSEMGIMSTVRTAQEEIPLFVAVVEPFLQKTDAMIRGLNMLDPARC